jgi:hypothetical protein
MRRLFGSRITCTHASPEAFGLRNVQIADEALLLYLAAGAAFGVP